MWRFNKRFLRKLFEPLIGVKHDYEGSPRELEESCSARCVGLKKFKRRICQETA